MRNLICAAMLAAALCAPAFAQGKVALESAVFVERKGHTSDGRVEKRIEPAGQLARGDRVVLMVEWQAGTRSRGSFAVTSPIPRTLAFQRASEEGTEVSVDGGRNWGRLGTLTISEADGKRLASPQDVTHLRWQVSPREAARGRGRITYSAIVR